MVDIHDRRPVVLEPQDVWRWMDPETPIEEAAHSPVKVAAIRRIHLVEGGQGG